LNSLYTQKLKLYVTEKQEKKIWIKVWKFWLISERNKRRSEREESGSLVCSFYLYN
jgi:hypothetical protein